MSNHLSQLLRHWYPQRDATQWVLGTVYRTEGPSYRKAGAMMLLNGLGQQFGMLSGGCLESDIQQHARRVMQTGKAATLCYDGSDEDDLSFQLGIGCGGTVYILLQPIHADNRYLQLDSVHHALTGRAAGSYYQRIPTAAGEADSRFIAGADGQDRTDGRHGQLIREGDQQWLVSRIRPAPHLLVVGGGIDARPLVAIAAELGWQVCLWDPRPANGRREFFLGADSLLDGPAEQLADYCRRQTVDAAVLMAHNVALDAAALSALQQVPLRYLAMLGPANRRARVLQQAGLSETQLRQPLAGPAGLDLGGELPESIALAILAECHAALNKRSARSLSAVIER
ncbi:XdhC family protein [Marinobacterium arenosum]|uniref:XdhC family protein n=1 Tax=Marinobacterium arenosum TaxID=2862496 RepID=UPI001C98A256|nr:XdhC/CoxI family protein [Marinobacterium arenosum]MBY4675038.1 XdhC/CoxI family protein [Marinobacterium arenosum]